MSKLKPVVGYLDTRGDFHQTEEEAIEANEKERKREQIRKARTELEEKYRKNRRDPVSGEVMQLRDMMSDIEGVYKILKEVFDD